MMLHEWLRPLSPYKSRTDLPSYRLLARTNDGPAHGWPRIGLMAMWMVYASTLNFVCELIYTTAGGHQILAMAITPIIILLTEKMMNVLDHKYPFDPLDWICDVICWGGLGTYLVACVFAHTTPSWWILSVLAVLWLLTYPWSTPR